MNRFTCATLLAVLRFTCTLLFLLAGQSLATAGFTTITDPISAVDSLKKNIEALDLTQNLVPAARAIIGAMIALGMMRGLIDSKSMVKSVMYGAIAMSLVSGATTNNPIKDGLWDTWRNTFIYAHTLGMATASKEASGAVIGLTLQLGGGLGKMGKALADKALQKAAARINTVGGGTQVAGGSGIIAADQIARLEEGAADLMSKSGLATAAIVPFFATYVMLISCLGLAAMSIAIGHVILLPALAAGRGQVLLNVLFTYMGLVFATAMTPFLFGMAIRIGYVLPLQNTSKAISAKMTEFEAHLKDAGAAAFDPMSYMGNIITDLSSITVYAIIGVVMVASCCAAAIVFLSKAPDIVMRALKT